MDEIQPLNLKAIVSSAAEAARLLLAFRGRWLLVILVFLIAVESLTFVPYVGFVAKLALAGLLGSQIIAMFARSAAGGVPSVSGFAGVLSLSWPQQAVLMASALGPFAVGLAFLLATSQSWSSIEFFVGNVFHAKPPSPENFFAFKTVMYVAAAPLDFIPAAVVLLGLGGWSAASKGMAVAWRNWFALLIGLAISVSSEWVAGALPRLVPGVTGLVLSVVFLFVFLGWSFAFLYTLSARAYGIAPAPAVARGT